MKQFKLYIRIISIHKKKLSHRMYVHSAYVNLEAVDRRNNGNKVISANWMGCFVIYRAIQFFPAENVHLDANLRKKYNNL